MVSVSMSVRESSRTLPGTRRATAATPAPRQPRNRINTNFKQRLDAASRAVPDLFLFACNGNGRII